MEIVVKHKDSLTGYFSNVPVNEYLVYLMDENKTPLECNIVYGNTQRDIVVSRYQNNNKNAEVVEVPLEVFKTAAMKNTQTY